MTGPGQIDPRQPSEQPGNLDQMRELAASGDDTQAPWLDETLYPDTTGTLNRTRYTGEGGLLDDTFRQSQPFDPAPDTVERRAERFIESQSQLDNSVREGAVYRCPIEGCDCEITVTHACGMPAIQRFIDCCGHEMQQV